MLKLFKKQRLLVADDDDVSLQVCKAALEHEGFEVHTCSSGKETLKKIETVNPELVILDYQMPGLDGLQTLKALRAKDTYVAVIFLSAEENKKLVAQCLREGADDYIRKPASLPELIERVKVRLRLKKLQDDLRLANLQLKALSEHDDLTGLLNMRSVYKKIDTEIKTSTRYKYGVACILFDIDHFKEVNDKFDHLFGSLVIREIGAIVKKSIRDSDFAARYGGDEFLIILTHTNEKGVQVFTERLRAAIEKYVFNDGKNTLQRTCSFGYSLWTGPMTGKELVQAADLALFDAKKLGHNRISMAKGNK